MSELLRRGAVAAAVLSLGLVPSRADAAGFAIFEQGARAMGFAGAFTAQADDPSAIFHNAAGIAFLKGTQVYVGGTLIKPTSDFTGANPYPGSAYTAKQDVGLLKTPVLYLTHELTDDIAVGIGLHVPFGLRTEWENPQLFAGRYLSTRAELTGFSINPTVAYKLADRLSVGAGLDVRFSKVQLNRYVPTVNPFAPGQVLDVASVALESEMNRGIGFNLGVLGKPTENLSFGLSYRHKVQIDYTGTATFSLIGTGNAQVDALVAQRLPSGSINVTTDIEFPSILSAGVAYKWDDWTVELDVNRYGWSSFDSLPLTFEGRADLSSTVEEQYEDVMQYRIGLEKKIDEEFALRGGYFFDKTPSPAESVSPLLPDSDRHGFALGGSWNAGNWKIDAAAWYIHSKERTTEGLNRDGFNGTYNSNAVTGAVTLGYTF